MTEPTDAEPSTADHLFRLIRSFGYTTHGQTAQIVDAIVANLWTPEQIAEGKERAKKFDHWLATTPQPTQAQAGAVPLTDEQIGSLACMDGLSNIEVPALQWLVREVEYLHGIKGGQHV